MASRAERREHQRRRRRWKRIPPQIRRRIVAMAAQGKSEREIAGALGLGAGSVGRVVRPLGGVIRAEQWQPTPGRLSVEDRVEIYARLATGESFRAIAEVLGRSPSTVCREVNANGGRQGYKPMVAHRRAEQCARRPKVTKLAANPELCARVIADLEQWYSPEQIAHRLRRDFPERPEMWVSHETIYASLFVQGRGELRRELTACLRSGRAVRRHQGRRHQGARIPDMVSISERPPEVEDRAVPGHWEGDLIVGKNGRSAIGTLVERTTRFVILLHLPCGRTATQVREAMTAAITRLPATLRRSITWDQGSEMAEHTAFSVATDIDVYFCDPHSPWQRGSNENTNGLLRQYFPKHTDLSVHGPDVVQAAADSLNNRPRKTLDWQTPTERLVELVATTA